MVTMGDYGHDGGLWNGWRSDLRVSLSTDSEFNRTQSQHEEVEYMVKPKSTPLRPGRRAPESGQYGIIGPRGGKTGVERTVVKDEPLPPTPKPSQTYIIVDRTKTEGK